MSNINIKTDISFSTQTGEYRLYYKGCWNDISIKNSSYQKAISPAPINLTYNGVQKLYIIKKNSLTSVDIVIPANLLNKFTDIDLPNWNKWALEIAVKNGFDTIAYSSIDTNGYYLYFGNYGSSFNSYTFKYDSYGAYNGKCSSFGDDNSNAVYVVEYIAQTTSLISTSTIKPRFINISTGFNSVLGLTNIGNIIRWGNNGLNKPIPTIPSDEKWNKIAEAYGCSLALTNKGKIYGWGSNYYGQLNIPVLPSGIKWSNIYAGPNVAFGLTDNMKIYGWGSNTFNQLNIPSLFTGNIFRDMINSIMGSNKWSNISIGMDFCLGLTIGGQLYGWGKNNTGQINIPVLPAGVKWKNICAGSFHSLGLATNGQIYTWGTKNYPTYGPALEKIPSLPNGVKWTAISAGLSFSLALADNGQIYGWGSNYDGQLNIPILPSGVKWSIISARESFVIGLSSDGNIYGWGNNNAKQLNIPIATFSNTIENFSDGDNSCSSNNTNTIKLILYLILIIIFILYFLRNINIIKFD